jgi:hypothetical protein
MIVAPAWLVTDYYLAKAAGKPWHDSALTKVIFPDRANISKKSQIGAVVLIKDMSLAWPLFAIWQFDVSVSMLDAYANDYKFRFSRLCRSLYCAVAPVKYLTDDIVTNEYFETAVMIRTNREVGKYQPPLRSSDHPEIKSVWSELAIVCPDVAGNLSHLSGGKSKLNRQDGAQARKDLKGDLAFVARPGPSLNFVNELVNALAPGMCVRAADGTLTIKTQQSVNDGRHTQSISGTALAA